MTIAQKHSHGYLLETISQHFCEEDGSYEQTALATKGKPLTARTNRNMECKGPYSVEAWRKTANWRNDVLAEIAKSMSFDKNVIQIAEYFLTTIGAEFRVGKAHMSKEKMGGISGVLAKWMEVLGSLV